jgi:hypothetical protein
LTTIGPLSARDRQRFARNQVRVRIDGGKTAAWTTGSCCSIAATSNSSYMERMVESEPRRPSLISRPRPRFAATILSLVATEGGQTILSDRSSGTVELS